MCWHAGQFEGSWSMDPAYMRRHGVGGKRDKKKGLFVVKRGARHTELTSPACPVGRNRFLAEGKLFRLARQIMPPASVCLPGICNHERSEQFIKEHVDLLIMVFENIIEEFAETTLPVALPETVPTQRHP